MWKKFKTYVDAPISDMGYYHPNNIIFAFKMTAKLVSHSAQELLTLGPNTHL